MGIEVKPEIRGAEELVSAINEAMGHLQSARDLLEQASGARLEVTVSAGGQAPRRIAGTTSGHDEA